MICEVCKQRNADVVFKTVTGGQTATKAMCLSCANNLQQDMIKMFMALGFRPESKMEEQVASGAPQAEAPKYICTHCGRPFHTLDEHTMAGCAQCYDAMGNDLNERFMQLQANDRPRSDLIKEKMPNQDPSDLQELKFQLLKAVVDENYEAAARLRDKTNQSADRQEGSA